MSLIKQLEKYKDGLQDKKTELVVALMNHGTKFAEMKLADAETSSPNQAFIDYAVVNKTQTEIHLVSNYTGGAGFVEFGTGRFYERMSEVHPWALRFGAIRGEWGEGHGENPPWWFFGEAGETGEQRGNFVLTYGQPANRIIYNTSKELQRVYIEKAKEVFKNDKL